MAWRCGGIRSIARKEFIEAFAIALILAAAAPARSAEPEVRHFRILVDNKPSGNYHMAITARDDGSFFVSEQADVAVRFLGVVGYRYAYRGKEIWKNGRLQRLESTCNDDGKSFAVTAAPDGQALRVQSNGQERQLPQDAWTTSCWRLPDAGYRNQALTLLDVDTGKEIGGRMQFIGMNQVNVAGQAQNCSHYRVMGGVQLELWYDAQERLVREEMVEDGHQTVLECVGK